MTRVNRRLSAALAAFALASIATGCAPVNAGPQTGTPGGTGPTGADAGPSLVSTTNCGHPVRFDTAPERVVTVKSTATELMLALGLGERIIGTAFQDGPLPAELAAAPGAAQLAVLAERLPSQEVVLEAAPDLVYSGWESVFQASGAGERAELETLGIATYVSPAACQSAEQPAQLDFEGIWSDIAELAAIFDTDASELLAQQREIVEAIVPDRLERSALWYSSGSDTPYVGAGIGAPQLVLETIGLRNIAGELPATWASYNWEAVIDADPDVIVLVDASWNTAEHKITVLEGNPATAQLDAVINGRYLVVPFAASEAGVRTAWAAADLARQLAAME